MEALFEKSIKQNNASPIENLKKEQKVYLREGVRLSVETEEFPILLEGRDCFESELYSETLGKYSHASAIIRNDKITERPDIVYNFEGSAKRISSRIRLRPGENIITIGLLNSEIQKVEEFELKVFVPGRIYNSGNIEFLLQENSQAIDNNAIDKIVMLINTMNRYLEQRVKQIFIKDKEFPTGSVIGNRLALSRFIFSNPDRNPNVTVWHELSHIYYDQLRGDLDYYLKYNQWKHYGEIFEDLFKKALEVSFVEGADKINRPWKDIKPNSVMELFNSAIYRKENDLSYGHPQSHAGELFAYGSEILLYYPNEFKSRLSALESEEEKRIALQIASQIAKSYAQNGILPEELKVLDQFRIKKDIS